MNRHRNCEKSHIPFLSNWLYTKSVITKVVMLAICIAPSVAVSQGTTQITDWEVHNTQGPAKIETDARLNPDSDVEPLLSSLIPHPYLNPGPTLTGGGYSPLAFRLEAGLNVESVHWVMNALAAYDNGHKVDDGDQPNPKGHDRFLRGGIYFRPSSFPSQLHFLGSPDRWFFGAGYRWSQLSTTNYTKGGNRPEIGGGYDLALRSCYLCRRSLSMRIGLNWVMAGTDWQNGSHGPETTITFPSLRENRHWFFQETVGVYRFHETVTETNNPPLTRLQLSHRGLNPSDNVGVVFRF